MYSAYGNEIQAAATLPIALYQGGFELRFLLSSHTSSLGTQIAIAQISVRVVKAWILRGDEEEAGDEDHKEQVN